MFGTLWSIEFITRLVFGAACTVLMLTALALSAYGGATLITALTGPWDKAGLVILDAVGYVVIALAVFDVSKYFIEEEVIRHREMRIPSEARRSLTKFISTILIAVFIEGLVLVFSANKEDAASMSVFPASILLTGVVILIGLGAYQWLSAHVEERVEEKDMEVQRAEEEDLDSQPHIRSSTL